MAYVDYNYYVNYFHGVAITADDFPRMANVASAHVDVITFSRAAPVVSAGENAVLIDKIKMATCAVADVAMAIESGAADGVVQESQGRYSVTFGANSSHAQTHAQRIVSAASVYLANTGLMFAGFYRGEYAGRLR